MSRFDPRHLTNRRWRWALLGAAVGLFAVVLANRPPADDTVVSLTPLYWGSLLAGYLAKRASLSPKTAGFRAAAVGFLASMAWLAPRGVLSFAVETLTGWWSGGTAELLFLVLAGASFLWMFVVLAIFVGVFGMFAGKIGGWIATKLGHGDPPSGDREGVGQGAA